MNPEAWADLLTSAGATPRLEQASCRGETWMADLTDKSPEDALDRAEAVCHHCPQRTRTACVAWVDGLEPWERPAGYAGGRILGSPPGAPRLKADPADDERWLAKFLAHHGPTPAAEVMAAGKAAGIPPGRLRAARKSVAPSSVGRGDTGPWRLLDAEAAA